MVASVRSPQDRAASTKARSGLFRKHNPYQGANMLLILAAVLLIIAIAGGVILHPLLFALAIVAIVIFFFDRRGAVR
jgi:hypothetical protein